MAGHTGALENEEFERALERFSDVIVSENPHPPRL